MSSASATRHQRLDPLPFRIAQPVKLFPHHGLLDSEALNHTLALAGIPYWVRTLGRAREKGALVATCRASRYIAAHDDGYRHCFAPPPPFTRTGARLILFVPPDGGPRHVFPKFDPRSLPRS